jgi:hypothetical protein
MGVQHIKEEMRQIPGTGRRNRRPRTGGCGVIG